MPKGINANFGVEVNVVDGAGKPVHKEDGKILKRKINMGDGTFEGHSQPLYFPMDHEHAGLFKGMAIILEERGFTNAQKIRAECIGFKCEEGATNCCCRRILYNQPDFVNVEPVLKTLCQEAGHEALFLPKFHCELNFIEQCWGYAKRVYRHYPQTSKKDNLRQNVINALDSVPLITMRRSAIPVLQLKLLLTYSLLRFATRSRRFMDAYRKGLTGKQAAWATKKYRGHRVLPPDIMAEFDRCHSVPSAL
jgi:hypothetical protein